MNLIIHSIDFSGSIVDGPGIRTVLFVQGCHGKCDGCHNPETWDIERGISIPVKDIAEEIIQNATNKKLTISGGEPLLQPIAILELLRSLPDFSIVLYTGFDYNDVPQYLLQYVDYIKVGMYLREKSCSAMSYVGSSNQKFIKLKSANP